MTLTTWWNFMSSCTLQIALVACLVLCLLIKLARKATSPSSRRQSLAALTEVKIDFRPDDKPALDAQPLRHKASGLEEHGRRPSAGSLKRRNTSISGRSREPSLLSTSDATAQPPAFPTTLQDITLEAKIESLKTYCKSQTDQFVFRIQQSERLARLSNEQLDEFWIDLYFEVQRRSRTESDPAAAHQVLQLCPSLVASQRGEAIRRMARIDSDVFVEMVQDLLYELGRRQRIAAAASAPAAGLLPPNILVRTDIDWKGHDPSRFGKLRMEEAGLIRIERPSPHTSRHYEVYLFDKIFLCFKPDITPRLKGRVFVYNIVRVQGHQAHEGGSYRLTVTWSTAEPEPLTDSFTMVFQSRAAWEKWATELRDVSVQQQLGRARRLA